MNASWLPLVVAASVIGWLATTRIINGPRRVPENTANPLGVGEDTLTSMVCQMMTYAYGYEPTIGICQSFSRAVIMEAADRARVPHEQI